MSRNNSYLHISSTAKGLSYLVLRDSLRICTWSCRQWKSLYLCVYWDQPLRIFYNDVRSFSQSDGPVFLMQAEESALLRGAGCREWPVWMNVFWCSKVRADGNTR